MHHSYTVVAHPIYGDGESGDAIAEVSSPTVAESLAGVVLPINAFLKVYREELEQSGDPYVAKVDLSLTWEEAGDE